MTHKDTDCSKYWNPKKFIGKAVFDKKGHDCGKIQSFLIDPQTFGMSGVLVKKRFSKEYFVSRTYFDHIQDSGLYLNSIPIKPNDRVIEVNGKKIGKITAINLDSNTNKLESIEVKSKFKSQVITSDRIVGIGEKITVRS